MIISNPVFTEMILPFLLVFVVVFAILQKSKILGDGKAQIDALVSLAIGLILITVPFAREIVVNLMPFLAIGVAVILMFLILYGFVAKEDWTGQKWVKIVFGILAGLFVIGVVIYVTGIWEVADKWFTGADAKEIWINIFLIVIIAGALALAIATGKKGGGKEEG